MSLNPTPSRFLNLLAKVDFLTDLFLIYQGAADGWYLQSILGCHGGVHRKLHILTDSFLIEKRGQVPCGRGDVGCRGARHHRHAHIRYVLSAEGKLIDLMISMAWWLGLACRFYSTIQYNTIQYNTIQYNTIQYNTIQYNTIQYNTIQYNTVQYNAMQCNTMQYNTIQYNTIQYSTTHPPTLCAVECSADCLV